MRLVHTADVHIGAKFAALGEDKALAQRQQLLATFEAVCRLAISEKAEVVLVAGDLFDRPSIGPAALAQVDSIFELLDEAGIAAVVMPGTHDREVEGGVWDRWTPPPSVTVLSSERPLVRFEEKDLTVHAVIGTGARLRRGLEALGRDDASRYNVAMIHGSLPMPGLTDDSGEEPIDPALVERSGMDYVALGHWHGVAEHRFGTVVAAYPGAPEAIAFDQRDSGHVLVVDLSPAGVEVRRQLCGRRRLATLELDLAHLASAESVVCAIQEKGDNDLGLEVRLTGVRPAGMLLDVDELESELAGRFFRLRVVDRSHAALDAVDPARYPHNTVIGRFVRILEADAQGADETAAAEIADALALGVALLEGKQVPV